MSTVAVKEHGILFSGEMVRAILDGRKTQTRRTGKRWENVRPGDVLWVRETWAMTTQAGDHKADAYPVYRATDPDWETMTGWAWKPSLFMPRRVARIFLEVLSVRKERLQEIAGHDVIAEGVHYNPGPWNEGVDAEMRGAFEDLWKRINGKFSWDLNPEVCRIEFRRLPT